MIVFACKNMYAQWSPVLVLDTNINSFYRISVPSNNNIWAIATDFSIYNTADGGLNWSKHKPKGLGNTAFLGPTNLCAINESEALLAADSIFTNNGPGYVYKTSDGGENWTKVFTHKGDCTIAIGMFNGKSGLLSCLFSGYDDGPLQGQELFYTINGGSSWKLDTINPTKSLDRLGFAVNGFQVAMSDNDNVYFSANKGKVWSSTHQEVKLVKLQFKDSSYAAGSWFNHLYVKRPGNVWQIDEADSLLSIGGPDATVLDGKECWIGEGSSSADNYYSDDSAKTFTAFRADTNKGFVLMEKARNGKTIVGATSVGGILNAALWVNTRQTKSLSDNDANIKTKNAAASLLQQNFPNPFSNSTTISYTLPQQYASAKIIITDKNGNALKQINLSDKRKGSVTVDLTTLSSGTYQYSLMVDGRIIESKQMMVAK